MTNPPIPPAVVEAMARIEAVLNMPNAILSNGSVVGGPLQANDLRVIVTAVATGSVVICSPIEKALIEDFRDLGSKDAEKMARLMELIPRYRAFIDARAHQENKG